MAAAKKSDKKKADKKADKKKADKKAAEKAAAKRAPAKEATAEKASAGTATEETSGAASLGNVIVVSKVREAVRAGDVRMAGDFPEALNAEVQATIDKAIERAKGNNRATVRPSDL